MMRANAGRAGELSRRLGENAADVCRHYLSNGRRAGRYWIVGNIHNAKGRSLYVRLSPPGRPGKWVDAASGEHGDLLDVICMACGLPGLAAAMAEAERFLGNVPASPAGQGAQRHADHSALAARLFAAGKPVGGTLGEAYLARRGITWPDYPQSLRFHPRAWFARHVTRPALIAAVRDNEGDLTGIMRTFLSEASERMERRALGRLNGHGVRFAVGPADTLILGEGLESTLSAGMVHPGTSLVAALSAAHMAAFRIPATLRHLIIAADNDPAGLHAANKVLHRARAAGITARIIRPRHNDFNDDLLMQGRGE